MSSSSPVGAPASRAWRSKPGSALKGIAYLPEGTGGNLLAYELFTELAWRTGPLDHRAWFAAYAERRYGGADPHAAKAWELLRTGPYSTPSGPWLADARSWGTTDAERATAEFMRGRHRRQRRCAKLRACTAGTEQKGNLSG